MVIIMKFKIFMRIYIYKSSYCLIYWLFFAIHLLFGLLFLSSLIYYLLVIFIFHILYTIS